MSLIDKRDDRYFRGSREVPRVRDMALDHACQCLGHPRYLIVRSLASTIPSSVAVMGMELLTLAAAIILGSIKGTPPVHGIGMTKSYRWEYCKATNDWLSLLSERSRC